jgi:hypothetical protein
MRTSSQAGRLALAVAVVIIVLSSVAVGPVLAQGSEPGQKPAPPPPAPAWKISGLAFGDYYYFSGQHDEKFDGQSGFWLRRAFFTYDHTLAPALVTRFRLEVNSNGKMAGGGNLTPFLKDAYLRWTYRGTHQATLGIQPTPTIETIDGVWGLRYVERVAADLYRFDTTRDFGLGLTGAVNGARTIRYAAQVGNDSGTTSETDGRMAVRLAARYDTNPGIFVEGAYWHADRPAGADREGVQLFAAYRGVRGRAALNVVRHERQAGGGLAEISTSVLSGFGVVELTPGRLSVFARLDRVFDPLPDGGIDYLPISTVSPFTFGLAGVEYRLLPMVSIAPNVEFVRYGAPAAAGSPRPRNDLVARASFYWVW